MIKDSIEKVSIKVNELVKNKKVLIDMFNPHYKNIENHVERTKLFRQSFKTRYKQSHVEDMNHSVQVKLLYVIVFL